VRGTKDEENDHRHKQEPVDGPLVVIFSKGGECKDKDHNISS
jgi:hypothetical protein